MKRGFTIIELLVVFSISALMIGVVFAGQRDFSRRRVSENAANILLTEMREVQQRSLSGVKPNDFACRTPNTLNGYIVRFTDTGYETYADCSGGEVHVNSTSWPGDVTTKVEGGNEILFKSVGQGTDLSTDISVNLCAFTSSKTVQLTTSGEINLIDSTCPTPTPSGAPPSAPPGPSSPPVSLNGDGLRGQYFEELNFGDPGGGFTRIDPTVNFNWSSAGPTHGGAGVGTGEYSVRWTGSILPDVSGTYRFETVSDDGVRLWVNGTQLINNWTQHPPTTNSGEISLQQGIRYEIRLEYFQHGGGAEIRLRWRKPGASSTVVIPQAHLYSTAVASSPAATWTYCATEGSTCSFTGTKEVRYGANNQYHYRSATNQIGCNNSVFGDPIYGVRKQCHYR